MQTVYGRILVACVAATLLLALAIVLQGILSAAARIDDPSPSPGAAVLAEKGEELLYEVSWTFIKLGTIRIRSFPNYTAQAHIDSYDGLPFVDLHSIHETVMDSGFYSIGSRSVEKKGNEWWGLNYVYDVPAHRLVVEETFQKDTLLPAYSRKVRDTLQLTATRFVDGLSIGFFPRSLIHTSKTLDVPTVLYGKQGITTFRFANKKTTQNIDVEDDPVRVIELEGTTNVEGIFGMTGDFTGWFSDDDAAVPIKGKLKVLIGSVTVELIGWRRAGWNPPH